MTGDRSVFLPRPDRDGSKFFYLFPDHFHYNGSVWQDGPRQGSGHVQAEPRKNTLNVFQNLAKAEQYEKKYDYGFDVNAGPCVYGGSLRAIRSDASQETHCDHGF